MRVTAEHELVKRIVEERESGLLHASFWGCYVEGGDFSTCHSRSQDRLQIEVYGYCAMSMTLRLR